jgi:hypothetical protein
VKTDLPDHAHLDWLIRSREANQRASLRLHKLLDTHFDKIKNEKKTLSIQAQVLTSVCFSLWRAAFLADKTGTHEATLQHAQAFLGKMLTDNAITYPQDRASREWTFNYYVEAARNGLLILAKAWPGVAPTLSQKKKLVKGTTAAGRRWDRHQAALDVALDQFEKEL